MGGPRKNHNKKKATQADGVLIHCAYDRLVSTDKLKPNPANPNIHPQHQLDRLCKLIQAHGWRHPVTVSNRSGLLVSGHARLLAARRLKLKQVPADFQDFSSDAEELAFLVGDNKIAELAETDGLKMADILCELDQYNYPLELTALNEQEIISYVEGPTSMMIPRPKIDTDHTVTEADIKKAESNVYQVNGQAKKQVNVLCPECGYEFIINEL